LRQSSRPLAAAWAHMVSVNGNPQFSANTMHFKCPLTAAFSPIVVAVSFNQLNHRSPFEAFLSGDGTAVGTSTKKIK